MKSSSTDAVPTTVLSVTKKRLWVIAGVIGAASVAAVPAISAQATRVNGRGSQVVRASIAASSTPALASTHHSGWTDQGRVSPASAAAAAEQTVQSSRKRGVARAA